MSTDTLTASTRNFYERTKGKIALSIVTAAGSLFALGYCAAAGGLSQYFSYYAKDAISSDYKDAYQATEAGYGFAAFAFILSFLILLGAAIYISPFACGTNNEKKVIRSPQEINQGS
eukprot:gene7948-8590_t